MRQQQIYAIVNRQTGKAYIGRSSNPKQRFIAHKTIPPNDRFKKDLKKYGKSSFVISIIEDYMPMETAKIHEEFWILYYKTYLESNGYNIRIGDKDVRVINNRYINWLNMEVNHE